MFVIGQHLKSGVCIFCKQVVGEIIVKMQKSIIIIIIFHVGGVRVKNNNKKERVGSPLVTFQCLCPSGIVSVNSFCSSVCGKKTVTEEKNKEIHLFERNN